MTHTQQQGSRQVARPLRLHTAHRERGSSLVITMILLLVVTLLGVTAMIVSDNQSRLAGNAQFQNAALNEAETAVAAAETWLATGANFRSAAFDSRNTSAPEIYPAGHLVANGIDPLTMSWSDSNARKVDSAGNQRYLVELLGKDRVPMGTSFGGPLRQSGCSKVNVYRVTARGTGNRGATKLVQEIYSVLSC